ncbi:methylated-DNA--[protein]-cysteine S-methyltransferase [Arthrobacter sp. MYb227]|uniref:methylated-DNA--[protein]-cysteine S-methyltransferase n=1 Tax=Arthrobacter sp. MYb227 TaxID=1848601 RepID=UPI002158539C|nr:methylated-DNA--[protein]-cysteine S-methyltransferase [Arthrobacter sp. MYb227]
MTKYSEASEPPIRFHCVVDSPIGPLQLAASNTGITGIYMHDPTHPPAAEDLGTALTRPSEHPLLALCAKELSEYFDGHRTSFSIPLDAHGTEFQHRVWAKLTQIPFGESRSYGDLALDLGDVKLTRAVGTANGRNPISIVVPCHRVIGADGSLTGYAGGLERKLFLLRLEGILPPPQDTLF